VAATHQLMREKGMQPSKLKMAAICSVCADPFVKQVSGFIKDLTKSSEQ
jgi:hypothetical protein